MMHGEITLIILILYLCGYSLDAHVLGQNKRQTHGMRVQGEQLLLVQLLLFD